MEPSSKKKAKAFGGGAPRKVVLKEVFMGKCPLCLMPAAEGQFARDARGNTELPQPENYGENIFFNLTRSLTPEEREKVREALGAIGRETDES